MSESGSEIPSSQNALRSTGPQGVGRKLRVGILVDQDQTYAWVFNMLERIQFSNYAEIVQVVRKAGDGPPRKKGLARLMHLWRRSCFYFYTRIDRKLSRVEDDPFARKSIRPLVEAARWVDVEPVRKGMVETFTDEHIAELEIDNVDVYIRLGFGILRGRVLDVGKVGIWSYHHGDNRVNRGLPPGFWEVYNNEPVTGLTLQRLRAELDGGDVLYRTFTRTNNAYIHRAVCSLYWKSVYILPRVLKQLHRLGFEQFNAWVTRNSTQVNYYSKPLYTYPKHLQTMRIALKTTTRLLSQKIRKATRRDQWILSYCRDSTPGSRRSMWRFKEIAPSADRFWADPFVIKVDDEHHFFFEELVYSENRGRISHISLGADGELSDAVTVLEEPYHLSYPFIIEHDNELYMIPESAENRTVDLYKCVDFPIRWAHVRTLIADTELVDSTLHFHDGLWWLFAGQRDDDRLDISEELSVFYTDDLLTGDWTPHPCNPVVSDARCARPAGKLFVQNGILYRPSQDCSVSYGGAINIRRIEVLNTEEYVESQCEKIGPHWAPNLSGIHTLNKEQDITVIDVLKKRSLLWRPKN